MGTTSAAVRAAIKAGVVQAADKGHVLQLEALRAMTTDSVVALALEVGVESAAALRRPELIMAVARGLDGDGMVQMGQGCLDTHDEGFGFLRMAEQSYLPGPYDIYVSPSQIRRFQLRKGDTVRGKVRPPHDGERFYALLEVESVGGQAPEASALRPLFDNLTPLYPMHQLRLEAPGLGVSTRVLDLFAPIGKGQRALIVAPPRTGKTVLLQSIANAITQNHPECELLVLLIDERPEEVTDMQRHVRGEVVSSTFDEPAEKHVTVAEMVLEKAKRLVEHGKDVVILLDSITRLARAYNTIVPPSGKILSGGVDSNALHKPKRFFGAARHIENGGSLTIIATALIDTGSRMDEVIFEEFKGTGNCELHLDRRLAEKRVFPALDLQKSGTRKEELLLDPMVLARIYLLRQHFLAPLNSVDTMTLVHDWLVKTKTNLDFLQSMNS